jgi:hypothetical protein
MLDWHAAVFRPEVIMDNFCVLVGLQCSARQAFKARIACMLSMHDMVCTGASRLAVARPATQASIRSTALGSAQE